MVGPAHPSRTKVILVFPGRRDAGIRKFTWRGDTNKRGAGTPSENRICTPAPTILTGSWLLLRTAEAVTHDRSEPYRVAQVLGASGPVRPVAALTKPAAE